MEEKVEKGQKNNQNKKRTAFDMAAVAMMTALIAVCSWISVPLGPIPFTMQTFAVFASVCLLGKKRSLYSILVYILLAAMGVPVLSGFKGGIGALLGTTGGYVLGFVFIAVISGLIIDKYGKKLYGIIIALIIGLLIMYAFGTAWFMYVYLKNTGEVGLMTVLGWCVFPYIIPDLGKMGLAIAVSKAVQHSGLKMS